MLIGSFDSVGGNCTRGVSIHFNVPSANRAGTITCQMFQIAHIFNVSTKIRKAEYNRVSLLQTFNIYIFIFLEVILISMTQKRGVAIENLILSNEPLSYSKIIKAKIL